MTADRTRFLRKFGLGMGLALGIASPAAFAQPDNHVYQQAALYKNEAVQLLERLVNIDSGTHDEAGLEQVSGIAIGELKKLGARVET